LPSGVTAAFNPTDTSTTSSLTFSAASTAATGTFTVPVTGVSGSLTRPVNISLMVTAPVTTPVQVNLSSVFNVSTGIATDGQSFTGGGLDGRGFAYSGKLLGTTRTFGGVQFNLGPASALDAVDNKIIPLPGGQFSALKMLATAVNGRQQSQTLTVTYTDGTRSTFTQSFSDWGRPQNFSGESKAVTMAYRDRSTGGRDSHTFQLYGYSLAIDKTRTVSSITLPNNRNVVVLAITLAP
jgi:hypothetical protein